MTARGPELDRVLCVRIQPTENVLGMCPPPRGPPSAGNADAGEPASPVKRTGLEKFPSAEMRTR